MGDVIDKSHTLTLSPGGYGVAIANMHHYAFTTSKRDDSGAHMQAPFALPTSILPMIRSRKRP